MTPVKRFVSDLHRMCTHRPLDEPSIRDPRHMSLRVERPGSQAWRAVRFFRSAPPLPHPIPGSGTSRVDLNRLMADSSI